MSALNTSGARRGAQIPPMRASPFYRRLSAALAEIEAAKLETSNRRADAADSSPREFSGM
jgi:hypothetical protein